MEEEKKRKRMGKVRRGRGGGPRKRGGREGESRWGI